MGKPRKYSDTLLNELIDIYIDKWHDGEVFDYSFNPESLATYWQKHGYPDINAQQFYRYTYDKILGIQAELAQDESGHLSEDERNIFESFDYAQFYTIHKNTSFCGLKIVGDIIDKIKADNQKKQKRIDELRAERKRLSDELSELKKRNDYLEKDNRTLRDKNNKLSEENKILKQTDKMIIEEMYAGFSQVIKYRDESENGRMIIKNEFLKEASYAGNKDKETPSMDDIDQRAKKTEEESKLYDEEGQFNSGELLKRIRAYNDKNS